MRAYGQKDPLLEYKKESFTLFQDMMDRIEDETLRYLYFMQVADSDAGMPLPLRHPDELESEEMVAAGPPEPAPVDQKAARASIAEFTRKIEKKKEKELADLQFLGGSAPSAPQTPVVASKKVGRNDPCFCGSGKKYKKCHGINE
jgi:preprotein translocase subunit SecA